MTNVDEFEIKWVRVDSLRKDDRVLDKDNKECLITSIEEFDEDEMLITYQVKDGSPHLGSTIKRSMVRKIVT